MAQSIQPLRINKNTPNSSPTKMNGTATQRPLAELSPMERRRNSPSFNQSTKQLLDSSPFDSSPFASKFNTSPFTTNSPRAYWQSRDPAALPRYSAENRDPREESPVPSKRSSIENLKRASRVKNSSMFAREQKQEYDPNSVPLVERPLAAGRPLATQAQNTFLRKALDNDHHDQLTKALVLSPTKSPTKRVNSPEPQQSPSKGQTSPSKSSLSKNSRYGQVFDPENGMLPEDDDSFADRQLPPGKSLHRYAKSVTFDVAPPQINEYEMTTPDPSSVASGSREGSYDSVGEEEEDESFDHGSINHDDSFDASLEDTDKTPVVLPEDWRFMSPAIANDELAAKMEDPFDVRNSSPAPNAIPAPVGARPSPSRTDSVNSSGERRPLPPLPPLGAPVFPRARSDSNSSLQATAERISTAQKSPISPPRPASLSKAELQGITRSSMSLEDRLRLMMLQEEEKPQAAKSATDEQRERRLRRAGTTPDRAIKIHEDEPEDDCSDNLDDYELPLIISRESILRKVKSQNLKDDYKSSSPAHSPIPERPHLDLDPDTPLPSLEGQSEMIMADDGVVIKQEEDLESEVDVYAIPDMYQNPPLSPYETSSVFQGLSKQMQGSEYAKDDDDESHYSTDSNGRAKADEEPIVEDEGPPTPRVASPKMPVQDQATKQSNRMSLPQFASMLGEDDFGQSLSLYMTPSPPVDEPTKTQPASVLPMSAATTLPRPTTPENQLRSKTPGYSDEEDEPSTPESVIRHPLSDESTPESEGVPEPAATIKAPGGKLRTRTSLAPADVKTMAETRRKVSGEPSVVPPVPQRHQNRPSVIMEGDSFLPETTQEPSTDEEPPKQERQRKSSLVQLDLPVDEIDEGLSFGLDREFDHIIEAQKVAFNPSTYASELISASPCNASFTGVQSFNSITKDIANIGTRRQKGYLMRQNTKMVVASSASHDSTEDAAERHVRGTRSAGNSPTKQSGTWTTEPWNGKMRRKSIRRSGGSPTKRPSSGPVPPLPGMPSNVATGLDSVAESHAMPEPISEMDESEEGSERGRLFVKVVGAKELDLPLPRGERSFFALTLDNGLHCVTTAWLELGKYAPIGQEFELVVLNDLEFQLTLQTKLEEPKPVRVAPSPTKAPKISKPSTFSRVFASPRKRKELELRQQQEEAERAAKQKEQEAQANKRTLPTAWDLLHNLVAKDGSFARSYVSLKDHESRAYGRPYTVDVPCFNEWAMEEVRTVGSSRSGRGGSVASMQRKAPYRIGKLEIQLLFVPKPKEATDDDMPKSMNACVRELQEAEHTSQQTWEGCLSQQGGDCPYWRRRFFRLEGPKLTAYHETTRQPRATINLAKASKLIDDKSTLTQKEVSGKGGSRRRSAFAAEEEGYMFVEEGFRVRFANGETIDFYADSPADKEGWMKALAEVVGKDAGKGGKSWTEVVLRKERSMAAKAAKEGNANNTTGMRSAPPTPGNRKSSQSKGVSYSRPLSHQANGHAAGQGQHSYQGQQQQHGQQSPLKTHRPSSAADKPLPAGGRDPRTMGSAAERRQKTRSMIF